MPSTLNLSVIIPVHASNQQSLDLFRGTLRKLEDSTFRDFEVLIADDGSPFAAAVADIAAESNARHVRLEQRSGPAAARNKAARAASADILVFLDADTSVHADTLERFSCAFQAEPGLDAVFGSYDRQPTAPGLVGRFRNLLHSFVHHHANRRACTFWAGCGAVRKGRFLDLGGFDESFPRPSIEDVEFGMRLHEAGGRIELDPQIQVTHHKAWTLASMVWTDFYFRAIPWAGLLRKHPLPRDLNFRSADRLSAALAALLLPSTAVALTFGGLWWLAPLASLVLVALLSVSLLHFLARSTSCWQAVLCFPLLIIYKLTCVAGLVAGLAVAAHRGDRLFWPGRPRSRR